MKRFFYKVFGESNDWKGFRWEFFNNIRGCGLFSYPRHWQGELCRALHIIVMMMSILLLNTIILAVWLLMKWLGV